MPIVELVRRTFRFNPAYRFVAKAGLGRAELRRLGLAELGPDYAGVLVPATPHLSIKAVCAGTAALLLGLKRPGRLPPGARRSLQGQASTLKRLVLDSVLEVKCGNRFATGAAASHVLGVSASGDPARTRIGALSIDALTYAQALSIAMPAVLSARLYYYNRVPASPAWAARLPTRAEVARFLGLGPGGACGHLLASEWTASEGSANHPEWLSWRSPTRQHHLAPYKLYVSVNIDDLPQAFAAVIGAATEWGLPGFKIGCDLHGLLRPDKFVLYVRTMNDLTRLGARLLRALDGARPQGTPFTAAIDAHGLLSWGMDPPPGETPTLRPRTSWRQWITDRLAVTLLSAKATSAGDRGMAPWQFALERLRLEGIDANTWTPPSATWSAFYRASD